MTKLTKAISLGVAVAMMSTSLPNLALADDGDRGRRQHAREYRDDDRGHRRAERHYKKERHYKQHKRERRYKAERHHRRVEKRRHKERKRSYDVLPLLAVVGITAAVLHANAAQARADQRHIDWNPAPAPRPVASVQPQPQGPASTCLMTREYQTQIVVNGKLVDGYGHACLQPDGSWYRGPAVAINY